MLFVGQNMPNHYMGVHRGKTGYNPIFLLHIHGTLTHAPAKLDPKRYKLYCLL